MIMMQIASERERLMEQMFHDHYVKLYLYALNFLEDEDEAKDVVSNVFAAIWQKWQETENIKRPGATYLYTVVRNNCIDLLRHTKAKEKYGLFLERYYKHGNDEDMNAYENRIQAVSLLIDRLPEPDKSILRCCYFKKMSYKDTAEKLQLTLIVVKKRMLKVFKLLREELRKDKNEA